MLPCDLPSPCSLAHSGRPRRQSRKPCRPSRLPAPSMALDYKALRYNPCNDIIIPSVVRVRLQKPFGPLLHVLRPPQPTGRNLPGLCQHAGGAWKEYAANPLIRRNWPPYYKVSHVSGPHAIWIEEEKKLFVYYHGENPVTHFASSTAGIHFRYAGISVPRRFPRHQRGVVYPDVRYTLPDKDNRYIVCSWATTGERGGSTSAWSKDGALGKHGCTPLIDPQSTHRPTRPSMVFPVAGQTIPDLSRLARRAPICHASEVDPAFEHVRYLGGSTITVGSPGNVAQIARASSRRTAKSTCTPTSVLGSIKRSPWRWPRRSKV